MHPFDGLILLDEELELSQLGKEVFAEALNKGETRDHVLGRAVLQDSQKDG